MFKFSTLYVFEPPFKVLGDNVAYAVHLRLIGKRVVDFLLVLIELFRVTAEALLAKIDRKSAFYKRVGHHPPNFRIEGDVPINRFRTDS